MRALIRKYPINAVRPENNEIWYEPWYPYEDIECYTDEGYRYALCENAPEPTYDDNGYMSSPTLDDFTITEQTKEVTVDGETYTVKYWTAEYIGGNE